ncbi:MAG: heparan-alpha-glucosaminide N-acetyltransferase domain-containing protein, partial [Anaerolineales bacterium]
MQRGRLKTANQTQRITSIDLLRGLVMIIMALDHVRMYFALGTWYSEPTDLTTTTPLLFFTRWITHFCAPVFVFLTGTSAFLYGSNKSNISQLSRYLFTRGLWLILAELTIINFAWTFDASFSFRILQVIWAIGASLILLSILVFLPIKMISTVGIILVFGHNLLDPITVSGISFRDLVWYALHQPNAFFLGNTTISLF